MRVARDKFNDVQREAGHGIKHFIAAHELIHVCGLDNSEHTIYGPDADLFIQQPQPFSGPFNKPDEDQFVLHIPTGSKPNVVSPPIFLKTAIADQGQLGLGRTPGADRRGAVSIEAARDIWINAIGRMLPTVGLDPARSTPAAAV
jgi:hypothetical protein